MNGIISNLGGIHVDLKWSSNTSDPVPAQVAFIAIKNEEFNCPYILWHYLLLTRYHQDNTLKL